MIWQKIIDFHIASKSFANRIMGYINIPFSRFSTFTLLFPIERQFVFLEIWIICHLNHFREKWIFFKCINECFTIQIFLRFPCRILVTIAFPFDQVFSASIFSSSLVENFFDYQFWTLVVITGDCSILTGFVEWILYAFIWQIFLEKKYLAGCLLKTKWLIKTYIIRGTQIFSWC